MSRVTAAEVRAHLDHPVVDADGHWVEYYPVIMDALRRIGGEQAAQGFARFGKVIGQNVARSPAQRRHRNEPIEAWWAVPTRNTLDRATAMMPKLLNERLDEFGIDFTVLYPTQGLGIVQVPEEGMRRAACRAYNTFTAEYFALYAARMTPAAVIPMYTPDEAIAELEHAVVELGMKACMFGSMIPRPVPALAERSSDPVNELIWLDVLGLDSLYDYDPVWQRCLELGISPTFHANGRGLGFGLRASPSNFTYNHIGHFAAAGEAVCKALFLGGVTRRFPNLKFGFLEGGVAWACQLLVDLTEHWELRNLDALEALNPANLDLALLDKLARSHGTDAMRAAVAQRAARPADPQEGMVGGRRPTDDFAACRLRDVGDIAELYVKPFWFGCEAEDRMSAWAFLAKHNAFGARLNATFGSDIGHFDVTDMTRVLPEAHELVDHGLMTARDFRDFTFTNPVRFFAEANPAFFAGTVVERAATALVSPTTDSPGAPRPVGTGPR